MPETMAQVVFFIPEGDRVTRIPSSRIPREGEVVGIAPVIDENTGAEGDLVHYAVKTVLWQYADWSGEVESDDWTKLRLNNSVLIQLEEIPDGKLEDYLNGVRP
ncbi:hypothetical protein [Streptomyces sp. CoH17]|uniref:hypothetical protein n=1 Tax=Streptomyces sp. CoH17 TaxID=2992806 RepID=UPI00226F63AE|nr:hypothetical protein [Streptomyces sp. CoH17]